MDNKDFARVLEHLQRAFPKLLAMYIYGSQARGLATAHSDLDVAILVDGKVDPLDLWQVSGALADLVNVPVDLVDFRQASTVMQAQILAAGDRYWGDTLKAGLYEAFPTKPRLHRPACRPRPPHPTPSAQKRNCHCATSAWFCAWLPNSPL